MNRTKRALITGATGAVGPRLVQVLLDEGYHVRSLARHSPPPGLFPPEVESVTGDVKDPEALQQAMQGVTHVFHLAALLHIVDPSPELYAEYEAVNIQGTANVCHAAINAGVERVVFFSSIAVYGYPGDRILTEETLPEPDTIYGRTKLAAEKAVLECRDAEGEALGVVLRVSAVYGPRIKGNYRRLLQSLARGRFIPIGSGENRRTLVYEEDVARAAALAARHPQAAGRIFNVTDGRYWELKEIISVMYEALGRSPSPLALPLAPVRLAVGLVEDLFGLVGRRAPIKRATLDKYTEDVAVSGERLQAELGFIPAYDLRQGWAETVTDMRRAGEL